MKKLTALFLAALLTVSLTSCSLFTATEVDDVRGTINQNDSVTNSTDSATSSQAEFSIGTTTGNTYENEFLNLGCMLSTGWSFYTDAQIAELNNITTDTLGDDYKAQIANANIVYDMFAIDQTGNNIYVILEKTNALSSAFNTVEDYVDGSISNVKTSLEQAGATVKKCEKTAVSIAGESTYAIECESIMNGATLYQNQVYLKRGSYIAMITFTTVSSDITNSLLSSFYSLK